MDTVQNFRSLYTDSVWLLGLFKTVLNVPHTWLQIEAVRDSTELKYLASVRKWQILEISGVPVIASAYTKEDI